MRREGGGGCRTLDLLLFVKRSPTAPLEKQTPTEVQLVIDKAIPVNRISEKQ